MSSEGKWRAEVCSAETSLGCEGEGVGADVDAAALFEASIDAVAIDNRERTKSNGYVVPAKSEIKHQITQQIGGQDEQTEVMPASAPLVSRVGVSNCLFPFEVNHCGKCYPRWTNRILYERTFLSCSYVVNWTAL